MNLKEIMAISGQHGLFKYIAQGRNGIIVEGLEDKKRINAYSTYKVSTLEDIAVFTNTGEVALKDVLRKIHDKENGGKAPDGKASNDELKSYFAEILPDYDRDKVYVSDMRKIVSWYNILQQENMLDFSEEENAPDESKEDSSDKASEETTDKE